MSAGQEGILSELCCALQLCQVISTLTWAFLTGELEPVGFMLGLGSCLCVCFVCYLSWCLLLFPFGCYEFCCQYQCNWMPGKTRFWNELLCIEWYVI